MQRPVEKQLEFPHLEILFRPSSSSPVSVVLTQDWEITGEVEYSECGVQDLVDLCKCLDHVRNDIADLIFYKRGSTRLPEDDKKDDVPF